MNDQRKQFFEVLQADTQILKLLGTNKAFWNPGLPESKKFSILPADKIYDGIKPAFLTIQIANDNLIGGKLSDVFIYVRCYNSSDKTFVDIDKVLSRVKVVLHNHRFKQYADNAISVNTIYETTGAESSDQAYNLNYRESRYRVLYL